MNKIKIALVAAIILSTIYGITVLIALIPLILSIIGITITATFAVIGVYTVVRKCVANLFNSK